jgi:hypothetical protein
MTMDEMEDIVCKLDEGLALVEARAIAAEAELARVLSKQQSSADDDECEICGSEDHSTDEHAEPDADDSASRQRDLNNGGKRKTSKEADASGGDKEGRNMKSKLSKIVAEASADYVVAKCLNAVSKGAGSSLTKSDYGRALDYLLAQYVAKRNKTGPTAKYYKRIVSETPEGEALLAAYCNAPGSDIPDDAYSADTRSLANRPPIDTDSGTPHQTSYKISKGLHVTRKEIEDSLDMLAASRVAKSSGSNFYTEYTKLLDDPVGKVLFNAMEHIHRYGEE